VSSFHGDVGRKGAVPVGSCPEKAWSHAETQTTSQWKKRGLGGKLQKKEGPAGATKEKEVGKLPHIGGERKGSGKGKEKCSKWVKKYTPPQQDPQRRGEGGNNAS